MIFKELFLENFGKFQNQTFPFNPGLNIITGKNEAGKSTLFQAFLGILFGFKSDGERYLSWNHPHSYKARLSLHLNDSYIDLERNFLEDAVTFSQKNNQNQVLFSYHGKVSPQGRSSEREIYLNKIQELFGFCDPDIFKNALFIEQRSLHLPPNIQTTSELKQLISNITEFKYDEIIAQLEEKYFQITKKNPDSQKGMDKRNDRLLEDLQKQIGDLEERIRRAHQGQESLQKLADKINQEKEGHFTKEARYNALTQSLSSLEQLSRLSRKEIDTKEALQELQKRKALIERLEKEFHELGKNKPTSDRWLLGGFIASLIAIPLLFFTTSINIFWPIIAFASILIFFAHIFFQQKNKWESFQIQEVRIKSQLEVLPDPKHISLSLEQRKTALSQLEQQKLELEKMVIDREKPLNRAISDQTIERETLHHQIQKLRDTITLEKQNYIYLSKGLESPFTLEEDLFDLKQKEKNLKIKAQALWTAKELLSQIVIEFRKEHLKLFAKDTEKIFQKVAQEKYQDIFFDEDSLLPSLQWEHLPIDLSSLSCGTIDQLYFSMKLSLLNILSSGRNLPIFLDDPFVNFDYTRKQKVLELLKHLSQKHQIFLFTYDPWIVEQLKDCHVIDLDRIGYAV